MPVAREQLASRRGLMMGMTLAEVLILALFALLLLLAHDWAKWRDFEGVQKILVDGGASDLVKYAEVASYLEAQGATPEKTLQALKSLEPTSSASFDDAFTELVRAANPAEVARLNQENKRLRDAIAAIEAVSGPDAVDLAKENAERQDKIDHLLAAVEDLTRRAGVGLPSCWYAGAAGGRPAYLWSIGMYDDGLEILDRPDPARIKEKREMGLDKAPYGQKLTPAQFTEWAQRPFGRGNQQTPACRFFVVVYDFTGADKSVYKTLLHQYVEGYFYKLLVPGASPEKFREAGQRQFYEG